MANDIASLGLRVDSSEVDKGTESLRKLAQAGAQSENAAKKMGDSWAKSATEGVGQANVTWNKFISERLSDYKKLEGSHAAAMRRIAQEWKDVKGTLSVPPSGNPLKPLDDALVKTGVSAKQTAAALRGVPAQFTDIAVSLQGGQSPLTVLLQQGGQLKDMFGGVSPAARALGGYVVGLINPFTVAAAAAATLAVAYKQGSDEGSAFQRALILTGNQSGQTADSMATLARQVSSVTGTTGAAADALAQIASTGAIASDQFKNIAVAAVAFESATGQAVEDTVAQFQKLAEDPAKASAELNEQYHYLTAAVYEQIKALQQQGDTVGAANLAEETYANALKARADAVKQNLGAIEGAWNSVKGAAKAAWDAMLNVGREQTIDEQIASVRADLEKAANQKSRSFVDQALGQGDFITPEAQAGLKLRLQFLEQQKATQQGIAAAQKLSAEQNEKAIAAQQKIDTITQSSLSKAERRNKAISDYKKLLEDIRKVNPNDERLKQGNVDRVIADLNEKYADPKGPRARKPAAYQDDAATRMLLSLKEQEATLRSQLTTNEKLTASQRALAQFEQQIADLKTKGTLTAQQKSLQANELQIRAQLEQNVALEDEIKKREQINKLQAFQASLDSSRAEERQGYADQLAGSNLSAQARMRLQAEQKIRNDYQRQLERAGRDRANGSISEDTYQAETEALKRNLDQRLQDQRGYYKALDGLNEDWRNGAERAFNEYSERAGNVADQTQDLIGNTLENFTTGLSDSLASAITQAETLGEAFRNLGQTIVTQVLSSLIEMGTRLAVNQALELAGIQTTTAARVASATTIAAAETAAITTTAAASTAATAATTATSTAAAATTTAAWTPAAIASSIGSFGTAAAIGLAAVVAALAFKGFSKGGYTGDGGVTDPAGIVHKGEVVWSQADIARAGGVATVESLRKGYAPQGGASRAGQSSSGNTSQGGVVVNLNEDASKAGQVQQVIRPDGGMTLEVFASNIRKGGPAARTLEQTYGLKRVGK